VLDDEPLHAAQLNRRESNATRQRHRVQPGLRRVIITVHMDVRRLVQIVTHEVECPVRSTLRASLPCVHSGPLRLRAAAPCHARDPRANAAAGSDPGADLGLRVFLPRPESSSEIRRGTPIQHAIRGRPGCRHRPLAPRESSVVSLRGDAVPRATNAERPRRYRPLHPRRCVYTASGRLDRCLGEGYEAAERARSLVHVPSGTLSSSQPTSRDEKWPSLATTETSRESTPH
jgi:hypothetical protein